MEKIQVYLSPITEGGTPVQTAPIILDWKLKAPVVVVAADYLRQLSKSNGMFNDSNA